MARLLDELKSEIAKGQVLAIVGAGVSSEEILVSNVRHRSRLEDSSAALESVCEKSGLGTPESMRRAFIRTLGMAPGQYRERFSQRGAARPAVS